MITTIKKVVDFEPGVMERVTVDFEQGLWNAMSTTLPWAKVGSYCTYSKASSHNCVNKHLLYYIHASLWLSVPLQAGGEKESLTEGTHHPLQQLPQVSVPRPHAVLLGVCAGAQGG
jgi:hypothetical protein